MQNENERLNQNLTRVQNLNADLSTRIENFRNAQIQLQLCNEEQTAKDQQIENLNLQLENAKNQNTSLQIQVATIPSFREQINSLTVKLNALEAQNKSLLDLNTQIAQLSNSINQRSSLNDENQRLRKQISELEQNCLVQASKLQEEITVLKSNMEICQTQKSALELDLSNETNNNDSLNDIRVSNRALGQQLIVLQGRIAELQNQLSQHDQVNQKNSELQTQLNECNTRATRLELQLTQSNEQLQLIPVLQDQISTFKLQVQRLQDRNENLRSLQTQIEDFQNQFNFSIGVNNRNDELTKQLEALRIELQNQSVKCEQDAANLNITITDLRAENQNLRRDIVTLRDNSSAIGEL